MFGRCCKGLRLLTQNDLTRAVSYMFGRCCKGILSQGTELCCSVLKLAKCWGLGKFD